ncbi:MAG: LysM peptidoglycan-binding domain-containing protein [Candidatus Scalindua sp.]|nr:LysM peptidoglycan-binding domain-containing protein [Candidatus Scalindua sp.]
MKILSRKRNLLILMYALSSCNYVQEFSQPQITAYSPPGRNEIKTVAILPFKNLTDNDEIPAILRQSLYSNLSLLDYDLKNIKDIDNRLEMASYHPSDLEEIGHYKLGRILSTDALIYGTVTKCSKLNGIVYSRIALGAEIMMVQTSNSEIIWKANHVELTHSGTPPVSPFSIPEKIICSTINMRDKVIRDTADTLAKKFVKGIPEGNFNDSLDTCLISIKTTGNREEVHYTVKPEDTLFKIAKKFYGEGSKWKSIESVNNQINSASLRVGQDLILPDIPILRNMEDAELLHSTNHNKAVYKVKWGDSLFNIASTLYHDSDKWHLILEENQDVIKDTKEILVGQILLIPLNHEIHKVSQILY